MVRSRSTGLRAAEHELRVVSAGVIGNVLEWYDFALFGFFAPILSQLFFPDSDRLAGLLQTFGVFAVGYLMRPLGGAIFGHLGDTWGRKKALELSVLLMALPTTLLGLLPTYAAIGVMAPLLLTVLRILQGVSVGGELIGSVSFLGEAASSRRRGLLASWTLCSAFGGILFGSAVASLMHGLFSHEQILAGAWRLPFLTGIVVGLVGLWLRHGVTETRAFAATATQHNVSRGPLLEALRYQRGPIAVTFGLGLLVSVGFYLPFVWLSTWLSTINRPPLPDALTVNTIAMAVLMCLVPLAGALSDCWGRRKVILLACTVYLLGSYPLFVLVSRGTFAAALAGQLVFAVACALVCGPASAAFVELFPTRTRYSGIAMGYNLAQATFGGTSPLIATWLISFSGWSKAPALYLMAIALAAGLAAWCMPERSRMSLDEIDEQFAPADAAVTGQDQAATEPAQAGDSPRELVGSV